MARQEVSVQSRAADSRAQFVESRPVALCEISSEHQKEARKTFGAAPAECAPVAPRQQKKQRKAVHRAVERLGSVSIIKRGKRFWLSYLEGQRHVRRAVGLRIEEARIAVALIHAQLAEGAPTLFGFARITPSGYMAKWLDYHQHVIGSSVSTIQRYRAAIRHFIEFLEQQGINSLDRVTPDTARHFVKHLRGKLVSSNGHPHTPVRPMKDKTIVFCLEVARGP